MLYNFLMVWFSQNYKYFHIFAGVWMQQNTFYCNRTYIHWPPPPFFLVSDLEHFFITFRDISPAFLNIKKPPYAMPYIGTVIYLTQVIEEIRSIGMLRKCWTDFFYDNTYKRENYPTNHQYRNIKPFSL